MKRLEVLFLETTGLSKPIGISYHVIKLVRWYSNETVYTYTLVDHLIKTGKTIVR
jgi:hypothetical protein